MTLRSVIAHFECDHCGERFEVDIDAACEPGGRTSIFDTAEHYLDSGILAHSKEGALHLCGACTKKLARNITTDTPTPEQILEALGGDA